MKIFYSLLLLSCCMLMSNAVKAEPAKPTAPNNTLSASVNVGTKGGAAAIEQLEKPEEIIRATVTLILDQLMPVFNNAEYTLERKETAVANILDMYCDFEIFLKLVTKQYYEKFTGKAKQSYIKTLRDFLASILTALSNVKANVGNIVKTAENSYEVTVNVTLIPQQDGEDADNKPESENVTIYVNLEGKKMKIIDIGFDNLKASSQEHDVLQSVLSEAGGDVNKAVDILSDNKNLPSGFEEGEPGSAH